MWILSVCGIFSEGIKRPRHDISCPGMIDLLQFSLQAEAKFALLVLTSFDQDNLLSQSVDDEIVQHVHELLSLN